MKYKKKVEGRKLMIVSQVSVGCDEFRGSLYKRLTFIFYVFFLNVAFNMVTNFSHFNMLSLITFMTISINLNKIYIWKMYFNWWSTMNILQRCIDSTIIMFFQIINCIKGGIRGAPTLTTEWGLVKIPRGQNPLGKKPQEKKEYPH